MGAEGKTSSGAKEQPFTQQGFAFSPPLWCKMCKPLFADGIKPRRQRRFPAQNLFYQKTVYNNAKININT